MAWALQKTRGRRGARNHETARKQRTGEDQPAPQGAGSAERAGAGKRTPPNSATARRVCACAGVRHPLPATWGCALGATVRWEL